MANRQTRRKEQKKKKEVVEEIKVNSDNILNKIIVGLLVICILGLFYLLTIYLTNKDDDSNKKEETEKSEVSISYEEILIGKTFTMKDADYIVVLYDPSNNTVAEAITAYKGKESHLPIYYVDMTNTFNKKYTTTEESNKNPTKASELTINGPTLIRVTNNNLAEYIEGEEAVTGYLN